MSLNHDNSSYTGWDYSDWQAAAQQLLSNMAPYYSTGKSRIHLTGTRPSIYGSISDDVEGFSRIFMLLGFWLKNRNTGFTMGADGIQIDWVAIYREGMLNGTDPSHPEYWGEIKCKHQYMVESASMALALFYSRHLIWDSYSRSEQEQIGHWFRHILQYPFEDKNWVLFGVIINSFLKSAGQEYYQDQIDFYLDRFDSFYDAEGWYRDGIGPQYDHYNHWALHFYPHLWSEIDPDIRRPELVETFEERSRLFLETFPYYFSNTASHPAFGRSLIYRCGVVAAAVVGCHKGFSPLSPGLTRRLCSQSLKYFWERKFFDEGGVVPLGWTGRFEPIAEKYSGPGSPLWLNKAFAAFLMPEDHAFWTAKEEPLPIDQEDYCISHKVPGFLVQGSKASGHVQLINQGSDSYVNADTDWKTPASDFQYIKFSYSSHLHNDIGLTRDGQVCGNMISLYEEKRGFSHRERIYPVHISDRVAISYHFPFGEQYGIKRDTRVETAVIMKDDHQYRIHWVISPNRPLVYEGGYTVACDERTHQISSGDDWINVLAPSGQSCVRGLLGYDSVGTSNGENINALGKYSVLPYVTRKKPVQAHTILACEVIARPEKFDIETELTILQDCSVDGRLVTLTFSDGESVTVKLGSVERKQAKVIWSQVSDK
ncbi:DUF2264 domain-containing protein [Candidatus Neomarinimicrobiota bacterium]